MCLDRERFPVALAKACGCFQEGEMGFPKFAFAAVAVIGLAAVAAPASAQYYPSPPGARDYPPYWPLPPLPVEEDDAYLPGPPLLPVMRPPGDSTYSIPGRSPVPAPYGQEADRYVPPPPGFLYRDQLPPPAYEPAEPRGRFGR